MAHPSVPLALLVACLATPAFAQDRPPVRPTRDVEVTYKMLGRNAGREMTMSQSASLGKLRVDGGQMPGYAVIDRTAHTTIVVMAEQHRYMELSGDRSPGQQIATMSEKGSFVRRGTDTVANVKCTIWDYSNEGQSGTACVTADGVMLRALGKDGTGLEAVKVAYTAQPADKFAPPAGFEKMTMPAGLLGAPGGGQGFTLPPGVKLPPGVQLPPGMTIPPR